MVIDGDKCNYPIICKNVRYHLVMPSVPRRGLSMQDSVSGDNNRTPVIFQGLDIFVFVGGSCILTSFSAVGAAVFRWRKLLSFFINHRFCGISDNNSIRRNVFRHHGSCTYYTSIANRYIRRNDYTPTDPTVIPD